MATVDAEHEDQIREWMRAFEALPEDRQDKLKRWFATQKIIIDSSGLTEAEWFGYVQWAMDNPFDYAFIHDFPDLPEAGAGQADGAERADATKRARQLVGGQVKTRAPDGPGLKEKATSDKGLERELFDRFMRNRRS
jgi:hypothetical protein